MSFKPFNYAPDNTTTFAAESYSYTVPTGYYSIVSYSLNAACIVYPSSLADWSDMDSSSNNVEGIIYLDEGDVLTRTVSAPSGTSGSAQYYVQTCSAILLVNSSNIASCYAQAISVAQLSNPVTHVYDSDVFSEAMICEYLIT